LEKSITRPRTIVIIGFYQANTIYCLVEQSKIFGGTWVCVSPKEKEFAVPQDLVKNVLSVLDFGKHFN
jgi:hypothetical protein